MLQTVPLDSKSSINFCEGCFEKTREIGRLKEENQRLRQKIQKLEKRHQEGYFGKNTPSALKPFKENSPEKGKDKKNGGAKKGHKGNGRKVFEQAEADELKEVVNPKTCERCGNKLISRGSTQRRLFDMEIRRIKKVLWRCEISYCEKCKKWLIANPMALPKSLYSNQLIAQMVIDYFVHGVALKRLVKMSGGIINSGSLYNSFHRLAKIFKPAVNPLIEDYRKAEIRHADETGWRTDGYNGYSWLFRSSKTSIYRFEKSRSSRIVKEVLGESPLPGYLIVDRYGGYNKAPCKIQYCYAHLLRMVKEYGEKYPAKEEVQNFVKVLAPLLGKAIKLRNYKISNRVYYQRAKQLKRAIIQIINHPAKDFGIQTIQTLFQEKEGRLYHWVENRAVPAENNITERELRTVVIARKISMGSQSEKGAETRSILMTILHTAEKRLKGKRLEIWFKECLDKISVNPQIDIYSLIPSIR